jgi:hypothetical protein
VGALAAAGNGDAPPEPEGPGVDDLETTDGAPILYDAEIFVRPKKEVAAANISVSGR